MGAYAWSYACPWAASSEKVGGRLVLAIAGSEVWGGVMQSVIQETERRRRRKWSLGSGGKWPIQQWRTQLPVVHVTHKDKWPPPQEKSACHTLRRGCVCVTYDLCHNRLDTWETCVFWKRDFAQTRNCNKNIKYEIHELFFWEILCLCFPCF